MSRIFTPSDCRKIIAGMPVTKALLKGYLHMGWQEHLSEICQRSAELFKDYQGAGKMLLMHMKQLLPMIAFYENLQVLTGSRERALDFFEQHAFTEAEKMMKRIRPLMKTGLYRLVPSLCGAMLDRMFGKSAGFDYRLVSDAPKFAVDMTRCPYAEACTKYGCPELTQYACRCDDVTYGTLHPNLIWARTQTLGMGGECCDFRLYVKKKP